MTIHFDSSRIAFSFEGGVFVLKMEEDEAQRLLRKYVKQDPYAQRSCSTVAEVASRYGFSEKKVRTWLENGCPFFRIESDIRIDDRLLDAWVEKEFGRNLLPTAA